MGDPTAGGPVDGAGIPLARRDYPVTLPKIGDPIRAGDPERGGELQIYNYADYLNPEVIKAFGDEFGVSVRVTTFQSLDEAFTKLSTGRFQFDVIFTAPGPPPAADRPAADPAAELRADPEPGEGGLAGGPEPVLRRRAALLRALHALHDRDRLAQRQARRLRPERARLGELLEVGAVPRARGRARRRPRGDRDGADAPRRDRPQHRGPEAARARGGRTRASSTTSRA